MLEFVVKRILNGLMVLWLIITLTFMLLRLMPEDPSQWIENYLLLS